MKRIDICLNTEEKIKETVNPDFLKIFLCSKFTIIGFILAILVVVLKCTLNLHLGFLIIPFILICLGAIPALIKRLFTTYYITNEKAIIENGLVGRDYDIVKLDRVLDVNLDVSILDSIFNTGSIKLCTANDNEPIYLYNIKNPKRIVKTIQF